MYQGRRVCLCILPAYKQADSEMQTQSVPQVQDCKQRHPDDHSLSRSLNRDRTQLKYDFGKTKADTALDAYHGAAFAVRERLIDQLEATHEYWK